MESRRAFWLHTSTRAFELSGSSWARLRASTTPRSQSALAAGRRVADRLAGASA